MKKPEPTARIYQRLIAEKPAIVIVDELYLDPAKRRALSACVTASAQYGERDEDGLPAPQAVEQLELLDEHVAAAAEQCRAALAASITTDGRRTWLLYGEKSEPLLRAVAAGAKAGGPMRAGIAIGSQVGIIVRAETDPNWMKYSEVLPTPEEKRWNDDLAVIEQLEEFGDDPTVVRPIEHLAAFPTESARKEFVPWLRENGFEVLMEYPKPDKSGWPIEFTIHSQIDIDEIFEQTCAITVEVERLGGVYDGWQTRAVEKEL
ncbi:MAG: DUF695 domain-containing protein [Phycisphaerae bacterium]|nr:DUF695 domain-containing protein [Phycisphaerae bacterium]MBN8598348.1 DUF695 domain-containing protein [Planctomycetota bacterium]